MNKRQAILAAADHIERNPYCYNFYNGSKPSGPDGNGCALAWIGYFLNMSTSAVYFSDLFAGEVEQRLTGQKAHLVEFFNRARSLRVGGLSIPGQVPTVLRAYADAYHPAEAGMPDSVRSIFRMTQHELEQALAA